MRADRDSLGAILPDLGDNPLGRLLAGGMIDDEEAPSESSRLATAAPIPFDAPVTIATLLTNLIMA
jgi:hypothetical protein